MTCDVSSLDVFCSEKIRAKNSFAQDIAPREPSPLNHVDSEHPSRPGENDLSAARYLSAASSDRGAFKINLAETKRDRSISIGAASPNGRALSESRGREIEMNTDRDGGVGVGRPTGSRFLNFRVINLVRHRQRRSVRVSGTTIVLIQISPIRSLTLALAISLSFVSILLPISLRRERSSPRTTDDTSTIEWTFNRLVMYCNRFVASRNHAFCFKSHYARRMCS